jgi:hypothetical protein
MIYDVILLQVVLLTCQPAIVIAGAAVHLRNIEGFNSGQKKPRKIGAAIAINLKLGPSLADYCSQLGVALLPILN